MERSRFVEEVKKAFGVHSVVALLGPRQCGKTTLAKFYANEVMVAPRENMFDLEDPKDIARLNEPMMALESLKGLIVIDEIQRRPDLFPILRVLVDQKGGDQKFLILGSASRELIMQSSETLTGRIEYIELTPFNYSETKNLMKLWFRGGYPRSYLAESDEESFRWRKNYIRNYLEGDVPNLGFSVSPQNLRRFWMMLTHYHGNIFNASDLGSSLGLTGKTVRYYLDILNQTLMIRELQPWHANISKRQVKSPKIYFRDSGLYHTLMDVANESILKRNPKIGASWEGLALEEIIRHHECDPYECYFWSTYAHAELDLLIVKNNKKIGFEFKYADAPKLTKSMVIAEENLQLDHLYVIYPGDVKYTLKKGIEVVGIKDYLLRNF